ncbi:MAG: hypothetical protein IJL12_08655 [Selenomonadaceae bacterium]|nr:hypothetical protein [Selenomonadaceae bacterium]
MKKTFAVLMLATMLFSVGCGNQAQDAAKDAQQKVEQKAGEAKDAANKAADDAAAKVDEAKDAANKAADDAAAKVDEMKSDANAKMDAMKSDAETMANDMASMMNERVVALSGLMPGTATVEDIEAKFGEAISTEGNTMTFADGLKVVLDGAKKVKSISTTSATFDTPEGMYVGAYEYSLNDVCGPADNIRVANGVAEYEYNSGDKKSVTIYKAKDGFITEIVCSLK